MSIFGSEFEVKGKKRFDLECENENEIAHMVIYNKDNRSKSIQVISRVPTVVFLAFPHKHGFIINWL